MSGGVAVVDVRGSWKRARGRWLKEAGCEGTVVLTDGKGLAVSGGADDEVVATQVKMGEPPYAAQDHKFTQTSKVLQPASHDLTVELLAPFVCAVRGVYRGVGEHVMQLEDDLFGTATDEPIMNNSNSYVAIVHR